MGSIGGGNNNQSIANNVIQFSSQQVSISSMIDNVNGWTYPEISENITKLEEALNRARSADKIQAISRSLRSQAERITAEIERLHNGTADVKGSEKVLLTQRRRIRQLMKKAEF